MRRITITIPETVADAIEIYRADYGDFNVSAVCAMALKAALRQKGVAVEGEDRAERLLFAGIACCPKCQGNTHTCGQCRGTGYVRLREA